MEEELRAKQEAVYKARLEMLENKRIEKERSAVQYAKEIAEREVEVRDERNKRLALHSEIQEIKQLLKERVDEETAMRDRVRDIELEDRAATLAFIRLQQEQVEEQARLAQQAMDKRQLHLKAISDVVREREQSHVNLAEKYLASKMLGSELPGLRGDHSTAAEVLRDYVPDEHHHGAEAAERANMIDEVISKRRQVRAHKQETARSTIGHLNTERREILERRRVLAKKRAEEEVCCHS